MPASVDDHGLLVPATGPDGAPLPAPAPAAGQPAPAAVPAEPPPERDMARVHLSMMKRYPIRCAGYIGLILGLLILASWSYSDGQGWFGLLVLIGAALVGCRFLYWILEMRATQLLLTNRRVILESGILSRQSTEFPLHEIADIHIEQGILGRMMGVGDLVIVCDNSGNRRQIVLMAVDDPAAVATRIRDLKG